VVLSHELVKGVAIAVLGALAACSTYVNGNGEYLEESREVEPFVGIAVDLGIEATVEVGSERSVRISGDANLVPDIETQVEGGILVTSTWLDDFDPALPLRLHVTTPYLESARAVGSSHLEITGASATVPFEVLARAGSEIHLAGAGGPLLEARIGEVSHLEARAYPVEGATVHMSDASAAELRVAAPGTIVGDLHGGSRLQVYGGGACSVTLHDGSTCLEQ
jgi:hypothetical protein